MVDLPAVVCKLRHALGCTCLGRWEQLVLDVEREVAANTKPATIQSLVNAWRAARDYERVREPLPSYNYSPFGVYQ